MAGRYTGYTLDQETLMCMVEEREKKRGGRRGRGIFGNGLRSGGVIEVA